MKRTIHVWPASGRANPLYAWYSDRLLVDTTHAVPEWWSTCILGVYRKLRKAGIGQWTARGVIVRMLTPCVVPVTTIPGARGAA